MKNPYDQPSDSKPSQKSQTGGATRYEDLQNVDHHCGGVSSPTAPLDAAAAASRGLMFHTSMVSDHV